MATIKKPILKDAEIYQVDDTTTASTAYVHYIEGAVDQYLEKRATIAPYTHEWGWGKWADRASITNWVSIDTQSIEI